MYVGVENGPFVVPTSKFATLLLYYPHVYRYVRTYMYYLLLVVYSQPLRDANSIQYKCCGISNDVVSVCNVYR